MIVYISGLKSALKVVSSGVTLASFRREKGEQSLSKKERASALQKN